MAKKYILWTGIKSDKASEKYRYGDFSWMDYSRRTWEHYAKRMNAEFIPFEKPFDDNVLRVKINWQRWLYLDKLIPNDYDKVLSTDASIMVRWDTPDLFDEARNEFSVLRGNENLKWTYESVIGYQDMFSDINFRVNDYFASGFIIFSKEHNQFWESVKKFYYENQNEILRREDEIVKRGRDQPVLNYLARKHNINIKYLPIAFGVNHMYRREVLGGNWQLAKMETDNPHWKTPHFLKYFYVWIFSGFPDRGDSRTKLMEQTWKMTENYYK